MHKSHLYNSVQIQIKHVKASAANLTGFKKDRDVLLPFSSNLEVIKVILQGFIDKLSRINNKVPQ